MLKFVFSRTAARRGGAFLMAAVMVAALVGCTQETGGGTSNTASTDGGDSDAAPAGKKRIVLLTNGNSPFWDACRMGLMKAAEDKKIGELGLTAVMEVNDGTPKGQIDKLRQFDTSMLHGVV